jgi:hydrogenase maturation protease
VKGPILVAAIGNIFLGDDGFAVEVVRCLAGRALPDEVSVKDFGIRGFDLACALIERWELIIIVDAIQRGQAPGTVYVVELDPAQAELAGQEVEPHGLDPAQAIALARRLGEITAPMIMVACEASEFGGPEGRIGLSPPVEKAVECAADLVESLAREFIATGRIRQGVQV